MINLKPYTCLIASFYRNSKFLFLYSLIEQSAIFSRIFDEIYEQLVFDKMANPKKAATKTSHVNIIKTSYCATALLYELRVI